jgi:hypothetical protein
MRCFLCRHEASPHIIRALHSRKGPHGWARVCIPCAIKHDLNGVLLSSPHGREMADKWRAHQQRKHREADEEG